MEQTIRVLMVEDSEADARAIQNELRSSDIPVLTKRVDNRKDFQDALRSFQPDLVLSDYLLASFDGLTAMSIAQAEKPNLPFIFVSWVIHEESVIETLKKGATDYVFKDQLSRLTLSVHRALVEAKEREELDRAHQKIIEQERLGAIGQMASGIAHDFNNALMPILGFCEILIDHPEYLKDKEKVSQYLKIINTSARDAASIVSRLREFYRARGKSESWTDVDVSDIVRQTVLLTQPKWKEEKLAAGITVLTTLELGDLPKMPGSEPALREALTNLIFNALDAMPKGGQIHFRTYLRGDAAVIEVRDNGVGMNEETRKRCLEPFYSTKGGAGTGLGLSMVYGVVRRHEGTIEIDSEEGKGTVIRLCLPMRKKVAPETPLQVSPPLKKVGRLQVLVVDDEPLTRQTISAYLAADGHEVTTASDGEEGLQAFREKKFDLVLTDRAMPKMNGDLLSYNIKAISPATPIIMITGFADLMQARKEQPEGVDILLCKPLTIAAYREAVDKVLGGQNPRVL